MKEATVLERGLAARNTDWPVVLTAGAGLFLSTLDTGVINVALPTLGGLFHAGPARMAWTVTSYLVALSTTILIFGRVADRRGRGYVYAAGLLLFAVASILCASASSSTELIMYRGFQGIGAAMLQATATALVTTCVPRERHAVAFGSLGMILGLGPVLGPSVGGFFLSFTGWKWIFWSNVPICVAALWGVRRYLKPVEDRTPEPRPGVPWILLRNGGFVVAILAVTVLGFATAVTFMVPPYFLEHVGRMDPWRVGIVNFAAPLGLVLLSRMSSRLMPQLGAKGTMATGFGTMLAALVALCAIQATWGPALLFVLLFLYGAGAGVFVPANLATIMSAVDASRQGTIGAVQRMVQNVGIALGSFVAAMFIHADVHGATTAYMSSIRTAWTFPAAAVLTVLICMGLVMRNQTK